MAKDNMIYDKLWNKFDKCFHLTQIFGFNHRETSKDAQLEFIVSMENMVCVFTFLVYFKKSSKLCAKKFDVLLANNVEIVNETRLN